MQMLLGATATLKLEVTLKLLRPKSNIERELFPTHIPMRQWIKFKASEFSQPVVGVIYREVGKGKTMLLWGDRYWLFKLKS